MLAPLICKIGSQVMAASVRAAGSFRAGPPHRGYEGDPAYPAQLVAGEVLDVLPGVLDRFPLERTAIVADADLAVFLSPEQQAELTRILPGAGPARPVTRLSLDLPVPAWGRSA